MRKLGISFDKRVRELSNDEIASIQKEVSSNYTTEGELRKEITMNIKRLQEIGCYAGLRHKKGLPFAVKEPKLMRVPEKVLVRRVLQLR